MTKFIKNPHYFHNIINCYKNEKSFISFFMIIRLFYGLLSGRLSAYVNGLPGSFLGPDSRVIGTRYITVGKKATIKRQAWVEAIYFYNGKTFNPSIKIGNNFFASEALHISAINKIEIGNDCLFGSGVYISDHNHGVYKGVEQSTPLEPPIGRKLISLGPVIIGSNVWFGDNVIVIGPVVIGSGAIIGANSVVAKNVPDNVIAIGAPLRIIKNYNQNTGEWERTADQ